MSSTQKRYYNKRQIWLADLKGSVGSEQSGIRPVVILKVYSKEMVLILPITSKNKDAIWYVPIQFGKGKDKKHEMSYAILSHVRSIHVSRLMRFKGWLNKAQFKSLHTSTLQLM